MIFQRKLEKHLLLIRENQRRIEKNIREDQRKKEKIREKKRFKYIDYYIII